MATQHAKHQPVIPEIAKAYENDPRTKLAVAMMNTGGSGAPVAQGGYAVADGIARALQGVAGGYMAKKQMDKYAPEEAELAALRKARGVDGLTGATQTPPATPVAAPAPMVAPAAPGGPVAAQAAAALGAPPPAAPQPAPPSPIPAPVPQRTGGQPGGPVPFGGSRPAAPGSVPTLAPPVLEEVPDAPAPVARPNAPEALKPGRSKLLDMAYRIMSDGNAYESAAGQEMLASGLSDQDKLNEAAVEREQRLRDMGYQSDLGVYSSAQTQDRGAVIQDRQSKQQRNFEATQHYGDQGFTHSENEANRRQTTHENALNRQNALAVAQTRGTGGFYGADLTPEEEDALSTAVGEGRLDLKGITRAQQKVVARALVANPHLNAIQLHAAAVLRANPTAQQRGMLLEAVPELLKNVRDTGKTLNFSDAKFVGNAQKWLKGEFNDPKFTEYMSQRADLLMTIANVMGQSGATDKRIQLEHEAASPTMSPRALDGWYRAQVKAVLPRIKIAERKGLVDAGTSDLLSKELDAATTPAGGGWGRATVVGQ
jgi:hypothetical protein